MTAITAELLQRAMGCTRGSALTWWKPLADACAEFDITTPARLAPYLATLGHESNNLTACVENLNYSTADRIVAVFRKFDLDQDRVVDPEELALARTFLHKPEALANFVYGGRMGNTAPGDGHKYRGRGPIQVTGRTNYEAMRDLLAKRLPRVPDFVLEPQAMAEPKWGALAAAAFWHDHGLNGLADNNDFARITKRVNGGQNGMKDRLERLKRARAALA